MHAVFPPDLLLTLLLLCAAPPVGAAASADAEQVVRAGDSRLRIAVIGVDDPARVEMLQDWAAEAARATLSVAGRFPLDEARVEIRQRPGRGRSAVPWGQTLRRGGVSVLLYVREGATLSELRGDWTAVHEFSHLFHPFLSAEGR